MASEKDNSSSQSSATEINGIHITTDMNNFVDLLRGDCYLGSGSFGEVYKYMCPKMGKYVALKVLNSVMPSVCEPLYQRFEKEIDVHKDLDHKNILKFIDSKGYEKYALLVIEYAEKGSIHDLMKRELFDRSKILDNTVQILSGLEYLHSFKDKEGHLRPIVHRDLRCANILITGNDIVKIADFGICKRLQQLADASGQHSKKGNRYWYAPELIGNKKGRSADLVLVDIWSLGVVILEMYYYGTLRVPYIEHYTEGEYIEKLKKGMVPKTPKSAPDEIKLLLDKCFELFLKSRPSATELLTLVSGFGQEKIDKLVITEEIVPPVYNYNESESSNDNSTPTLHNNNLHTLTPDIKNAADDDENEDDDEDSKYLTKKIPYKTRGIEEFILEDREDQGYVVKKGDTDEEVFKITFDEADKILTLKVKQSDNEVYSINCINTDHENDGQLFGEGSYANVNIGKTIFRDRNKRLELNSINPGALSITSILRLRLNDISLVVKKNKESSPRHSAEYSYIIRYKDDAKTEIGKFNTLVEHRKCEIVAQPQTDTALITAVVAFYYKYKSKKKGGIMAMLRKFTWGIGSRHTPMH